MNDDDKKIKSLRALVFMNERMLTENELKTMFVVYIEKQTASEHLFQSKEYQTFHSYCSEKIIPLPIDSPQLRDHYLHFSLDKLPILVFQFKKLNTFVIYGNCMIMLEFLRMLNKRNDNIHTRIWKLISTFVEEDNDDDDVDDRIHVRLVKKPNLTFCCKPGKLLQIFPTILTTVEVVENKKQKTPSLLSTTMPPPPPPPPPPPIEQEVPPPLDVLQLTGGLAITVIDQNHIAKINVSEAIFLYDADTTAAAFVTDNNGIAEDNKNGNVSIAIGDYNHLQLCLKQFNKQQKIYLVCCDVNGGGGYSNNRIYKLLMSSSSAAVI